MKKILVLFVLIIFGLSLYSCVTNPVTGQKELDLIPPSQEIAMGRQEYKKVLSQFDVYRYKDLNRYIEQVGERLVPYVQDKNIKYTFTLLDSPVVNAFSTPGGYVYITRGILAYLNNEAQLACVLGHEMGHINAHHVATLLSKQMLFNLGLSIAYIKSKKFRKFAPLIGIAGNLLFLSFSRSDEYQADYLGVEYATLAGYDATQMAYFFDELERIEVSENAILPEFLSTHPSPPHRKERVIRLAKEWQAIAKRRYYEIGRDVYLEHINGILFGKNKRNGYTIGNHYYHPNLRFTFTFPKGWKLIDMAHYIGIVPKNVKNTYVKITIKRGSIYTLADKFASFGLVLESREVYINGLNAFKVIRLVKIANKPIVQAAYFIDFNGKTFMFFMQAPSIVWPLFKGRLEEPALSFRRLRDPRRINVKNLYVKVVKVPYPMEFHKLLERFRVPKKLRKKIYIMNNMYRNTLLAQGEMVKILVKR